MDYDEITQKSQSLKNRALSLAYYFLQSEIRLDYSECRLLSYEYE